MLHLASFKSDVREHFGFPVLSNDEGEKATDRQKNISSCTRGKNTNDYLNLFSTPLFVVVF